MYIYIKAIFVFIVGRKGKVFLKCGINLFFDASISKVLDVSP